MVPLTSNTTLLYMKERYSPMYAMMSHIIKRFNDIAIYQ